MTKVRRTVREMVGRAIYGKPEKGVRGHVVQYVRYCSEKSKAEIPYVRLSGNDQRAETGR